MDMKPPKKRTYNGKGDPRCQGDSGLRPAQIVPPEVYQSLGKRFRKTKARMDTRRGRNRMKVRCYWYRRGDDGKLIGIGSMVASRVVDRVEWVDPVKGWIRGWVIWAGEYVEVRKFMGEKYWKLLRLVEEGDGNGDGDKSQGGQRDVEGYKPSYTWIGRGKPIGWDRGDGDGDGGGDG